MNGQHILRDALICPLCERAIPPPQCDAHHLVPRSKGGRHTEFRHRVCHRQVHALFTETELARQYATVEALLAHPEMQTFVAWVKTKPGEFFVHTRKSARVRKRRRFVDDTERPLQGAPFKMACARSG